MYEERRKAWWVPCLGYFAKVTSVGMSCRNEMYIPSPPDGLLLFKPPQRIDSPAFPGCHKKCQLPLIFNTGAVLHA